MRNDALFEKIDSRITRDKEDGDYAYFQALCLKLEYLMKIVTSGLIACIGDDPKRHRYSLEHRLVRADSLGNWEGVLNNALNGPPSQYFGTDGRELARDLTVRVGAPDWRYSAVSNLHLAANRVGTQIQMGTKVALRQFFEIAVALRNRSRGHGAPTNYQCSKACHGLADALDTVVGNMELFKLSWVYLHRNLSKKYRVSRLLGDPSPFDHLKSTRDEQLPDGVYFYLGGPVRVPLVFSDPDVTDIALPNGNHREDKFETLSYISNVVQREDSSAWTVPPDRLPKSETEGAAELDIFGKTFANVPRRFHGYVTREDIERGLKQELMNPERHPIISLTGPGGIGKTAIAIAAIHVIAEQHTPPYEVILWISARDIDLLETGPKAVEPRVVTQRDISRAAVELLEPSERSDKDFDPEVYFQTCLAEGTSGPTLFVLDNFETVQSPNDVFRWIDTHIRPPNKVLITTRFRDFNADYAIKVGGMTDQESATLVDAHADRLGITSYLNAKYKEKLIRESDGHPYVMKISLGQVAKQKQAVEPERIVASADDLLKALFERTYVALSPAAQRVFLLLCSWRVFVPEVAVEAVSIRPGTERFDVAEALQELNRFSLVDQVYSEEEEKEAFVGVPLAAAIYGRRKLDVSPFKFDVEEDRKLLMEFGAAQKEAAKWGILPRIDNLIRAVADRASQDPSILEDDLPVLEYLAERVPKAYLKLSELVREVDPFGKMGGRAKRYILKYLEVVPRGERLEAWRRLAKICQSTQDGLGEIHALSEAALLVSTDLENMGYSVDSLNRRIRDLKAQNISDDLSRKLKGHLVPVIEAMERNLNKLSATNCSRLAWLYLNVSNADRALDVAKLGAKLEPQNWHCRNLIEKLNQ